MVLNAFRHHRGGHDAAAERRLVAQVQCSTPFGITEVGIPSQPPDSCIDSSAVCSTPFGITEVGMPAGVDAATGRDSRCSTPFGITEVGIDWYVGCVSDRAK